MKIAGVVMSICNSFRSIKSVNTYRKPIVAIAIVAIIMDFSTACGKEHVAGSNDPLEVEVLSKEIMDIVKGLEYSDEVAEDFVKMVMNWKDKRGRPVLVVWREKLVKTKDSHKQGKISEVKFVKVEERIVKELSQRIQKEISPSRKFFDLADVIKHKQAQCFSYSQLVYIIGNSVGLSVQAIDVVELMTGLLPPIEAGHIASIVSLTDGRTMMLDLVIGGFISKPFIIEEEFTKFGNYWELKDKTNPLGIHRRIQILYRNEVIAGRYNSRGIAYGKLGQFPQAISDFNRAIELNPKYALAYCNRGHAYDGLGQLTQAISDYNKAIELNQKEALAYINRGNAYRKLGQLTQAISDYTKTIELNPKDALAYYNRGNAYDNLGQLTQAISDYNKAIELNPKYALAYNNRGVTYRKLGQFTQAISDYTKTIELDPKYAGAYCNRGVAYVSLQKLVKAKKDLLKAVELNPALKPLVKRISDHFKLNLQFD